MVYATEAELYSYLTEEATPTITISGAARLLKRASELIDYETNYQIDATDEDDLEAAKNAVCAQVEYWQETSESLVDITGYKGQMRLGDLTQDVNYKKLAPRAYQYLWKRNLMNRSLHRW